MTKINPNQIDIGNESALDLLIERNTAKADLATNLQGKGINADASTETLNQLVNKVPNIQSTSDRELLECITIDLHSSQTQMGSYSRDVYTVKSHGYVFYMFSSSSNYLRWVKISDLESDTAFITGTSAYSIDTAGIAHSIILSAGQDVTTSNIHKFITISKDGTKLFICNNKTTGNLIKCSITWNDDTIEDITVDDTVTVLNNSSTAKAINNIDSNSDGSKLLLTMNDTNGLYLYDTTTGTNTLLSDIPAVTSVTNTNPYMVGYWINDTNFIVAYIRSISNNITWYISQYTITGTTVTNVVQDVISGNITDANQGSNYWSTGLKIYEYDINKYKVLIYRMCGYDQNTDRTYLGIYDTDTHEITEYTGKTFFASTDSGLTLTPDIKHDTVNHRYIITTQRNTLFIFDENWNLINSINQIMKRPASTWSLRSAFFGENNNLIIIYSNNAAKVIPYYYGKKTITKKTVSINEIEKIYYYTPAQEILVSDIEDGYYD